MVLFYLGRLDVHRLAAHGWTEQSFRAQAALFAFLDQLVSGLRSGRYVWRGDFRSDGRDAILNPVQAWRDVPSLQYCDLYEQLDTEQPPNRILDAFELLGAISGARVARDARKVLAQRRQGRER